MTQFEQNTPEATAHQNYNGYYDHLDCILEKTAQRLKSITSSKRLLIIRGKLQNNFCFHCFSFNLHPMKNTCSLYGDSFRKSQHSQCFIKV